MAQTANPETIMTSNFLIILGLIAASAFFTASEIAFAASRKLKLQHYFIYHNNKQIPG